MIITIFNHPPHLSLHFLTGRPQLHPGNGHSQPQQETSLHKVFTPERMVTSRLSELTLQRTPRRCSFFPPQHPTLPLN